MIVFAIISFLAGGLTIATPCIVPVLPFVMSRAGVPFRRGGLPMLLGLALALTTVASLAAVGGGWAVAANRYGRAFALATMGLVGMSMIAPRLAAALARPMVYLGARLLDRAEQQTGINGRTVASSLLVGVATGLVWAPCAGPVLGLILTGAALHGPGLETSLLLLSYGMGAATALATGMLAGKKALAAMRRSIQWGDRVRKVLGATVIASAVTIGFGIDTQLLTGWTSSTATALEQDLLGFLPKPQEVMMDSARADQPPALPPPLASLLGARQWLNSPPLRTADLQGKVVLVNFWTYSCINCLRALPHVRAWAERYRDRGLVVVGVHTPEFAFERDVANVTKAASTLGVTYPIAIDSDFSIWRAFGNRAWPALYVVGPDGRLRHRVLGEGRYEQSEKVIQELLSEVKAGTISTPMAPIDDTGAQAPADARNLRSGETYTGFDQARGFSSVEPIQKDTSFVYHAVAALDLNQWALAGRWTIGSEYASADAMNGRVAYRFHARDLHLVLGSSNPARSIRFRVTLDGAAPGADHGADVDAEGWGSLQSARLYQLIRQTGPIIDRNFQIEFFDSGARIYAFTFG